MNWRSCTKAVSVQVVHKSLAFRHVVSWWWVLSGCNFSVDFYHVRTWFCTKGKSILSDLVDFRLVIWSIWAIERLFFPIESIWYLGRPLWFVAKWTFQKHSEDFSPCQTMYVTCVYLGFCFTKRKFECFTACIIKSVDFKIWYRGILDLFHFIMIYHTNFKTAKTYSKQRLDSIRLFYKGDFPPKDRVKTYPYIECLTVGVSIAVYLIDMIHSNSVICNHAI